MSARRVAWLLAAGVAVIAFAIWLSSRRHLERDLAAGSLVLPGLEQSVNAVTTVSLRKGDDTHATLRKDGNGKDGSGWSVGERAWPADVGKVRKLLLNLGALNIVEEKTRLPVNYPELGVEDVTSPKATGTRIEIAAPPHNWAVIVGKSSGAKSGYVRVANAPQSLLAAPLLTVDADPKVWLDHGLIDLNVERVREVEEHPAGGTAFSATREKKEQSNFSVQPLPKGRQLSSPGAADGMAAALSALTLDDVRKAPTDSDASRSRAVFRTFDGLEVEIDGRKDGTHSLVTLSARSTAEGTAAEANRLEARFRGWEFEIPDYKYNAVFTPLDQLLQPLPAPAKKSTPARKTAGGHTDSTSPLTAK